MQIPQIFDVFNCSTEDVEQMWVDINILIWILQIEQSGSLISKLKTLFFAYSNFLKLQLVAWNFALWIIVSPKLLHFWLLKLVTVKYWVDSNKIWLILVAKTKRTIDTSSVHMTSNGYINQKDQFSFTVILSDRKK